MRWGTPAATMTACRPPRPSKPGRIAAGLAAAGFALPGTLTERMTRCGHPGCRCHADPPRLHGPYHQWTRKINGKTVTGILTGDQLADYQPWFDNERRLRSLVADQGRTDRVAGACIIFTMRVRESISLACSRCFSSPDRGRKPHPPRAPWLSSSKASGLRPPRRGGRSSSRTLAMQPLSQAWA